LEAHHGDAKDSDKPEAEQQHFQSSGPSSTMTTSFLRQPTLVKASKKHEIFPNAKLIIPQCPRIFLPPRDDAAEFDESGPDLRGIVDDKSVISWRKGNKAGIILSAKISSDLQDGDEIITGFALKFVYTNTVPALEQREIQKSEVIIPVYVILGKATAITNDN
jgi:hypothetical protein